MINAKIETLFFLKYPVFKFSKNPLSTQIYY